jgi:hypothetical protein
MAGGPSGGAGTLRIGQAGTDLRGPARRDARNRSGQGRSSAIRPAWTLWSRELLERFGLDPTKQCRSSSKGNQAEALSATPLVAMTAVAALLLAAGLVGLRRRDLR